LSVPKTTTGSPESAFARHRARRGASRAALWTIERGRVLGPRHDDTAGSRRDLRIPILREPLVIEHGMAQVAHSTATGVDWNEQAVQRYAS
jgi:GTPase